MREYPEKYITAFMTSSRRSEILKSANIGKDKYYTLKNDADFMKIVNDRRSEIIKDAVLKMESYLGENVDILQDIIRNPDTKDQVKVNALKLFSDQLGQWKNTSDILERLQHLEDMQGQNADV
jgi:hypothetical protein